MMQMLDQSKEFFEREINSKESLITKALQGEQKDTDDKITTE
jgi:hypothetical protein